MTTPAAVSERALTALIEGHALTDQERRLVLYALEGHALHFDDWIRETPDRGPRITAVRSRVSDLEARGWRFSHVRRGDTTVEYRLLYVPPLAPPEPARLFEPPATAPLNAVCGWEDEAA
jgi:hypothetical protein